MKHLKTYKIFENINLDTIVLDKIKDNLPTVEKLLDEIAQSEEWGYENYYDFSTQQQSHDDQLKLTKQVTMMYAKLCVEYTIKSFNDVNKH